MTAKRSVVLGCGSYLPQKVLTNAELAARIDTSDEWIVQRTGMRERRIAGPSDTTASLALAASQKALAAAGLEPKDVDLSICATITGEMVTPSTACFVAASMGLSRGKWAEPRQGARR